jgi:hypothetical protein
MRHRIIAFNQALFIIIIIIIIIITITITTCNNYLIDYGTMNPRQYALSSVIFPYDIPKPWYELLLVLTLGHLKMTCVGVAGR